jgi:hypothetical protein
MDGFASDRTGGEWLTLRAWFDPPERIGLHCTWRCPEDSAVTEMSVQFGWCSCRSCSAPRAGVVSAFRSVSGAFQRHFSADPDGLAYAESVERWSRMVECPTLPTASPEWLEALRLVVVGFSAKKALPRMQPCQWSRVLRQEWNLSPVGVPLIFSHERDSSAVRNIRESVEF